MLKIYLARHGQDKDNEKGILNGRRDQPLTELGEQQAGELASKIKKAGIIFDRVYSSPLQRTYKTAEIITASLGLEKPEKLTGLIERDFGIMTGKPQTMIVEMCAPDILRTERVVYFLSPSGAETFPDLVERGKQVLSEIKNKHEKGNILLVTHGDFGKMIFAAYYNLDWIEVLQMFHFGNSELLLLSSGTEPQKAQVFKTRQFNL